MISKHEKNRAVVFKNLSGRDRDPVSPVPLLQVMREVHPCKVLLSPNLGAERIPHLTQRLSIPCSLPLTSLWQHLSPCTLFGNNLPDLKWWFVEKNNPQHSHFPFIRHQPTLPVKKKSSIAPSSPKYCQPKYSFITFKFHEGESMYQVPQTAQVWAAHPDKHSSPHLKWKTSRH